MPFKMSILGQTLLSTKHTKPVLIYLVWSTLFDAFIVVSNLLYSQTCNSLSNDDIIVSYYVI